MNKRARLFVGLGIFLVALVFGLSNGLFPNISEQLSLPTPTPASLKITPTVSPTGITPPEGSETQETTIFLVAIGDEGASGEEIGCGDSLVPVTREIERTEGVLVASLEELFSLNDQYLGESGLYNALYRSDLTVTSATVEDGTAVVRLSGQLSLGGVCDNPRVEEQITATIEQFETVEEAEIFLNDEPLSDVLSGR